MLFFFVKYEILTMQFLLKMGFSNVNFVKNVNLKVRFFAYEILKCDFCEKNAIWKLRFLFKMGFYDVLFVKNVILKYDFC